MKKLRITVEGKEYEVTVEDGGCGAGVVGEGAASFGPEADAEREEGGVHGRSP